MKKLLLSAVMAAISTVAVLGVTDIDGISYDLNFEARTAKVVGGPYEGQLTIPQTVTRGIEYTVTELDFVSSERYYEGSSYGTKATVIDTLSIPASVKNITDKSLDGLWVKKKILVDENNSVYKSINGSLYSKDGKTLLRSVLGGDSVVNYYSSYYGNRDEWKYPEESVLVDFVVPDGVTTIGEFAFGGSYTSSGAQGHSTSFFSAGPKSITIPNSVTKIGKGAIDGLYCLKSVKIGNGVTSIDSVFQYVPNLKDVTIGSGLASITPDVFIACSKLENVNIDSNNPTLKSIDGVVYSKDGKTLLYCPTGKTGTLVIPNGVENVVADVFSNNNGLTGVTISDDCTTLKKDKKGIIYSKDGKTLLYCPRDITGNLVIPSGVTSIGGNAFNGCSGLTSVTLPENLKSIGEKGFYGCSSLTSIDIPNAVTSIGDQAFYGCDKLESITIGSGITNDNVFEYNKLRYLKIYTVDEANTVYASQDGVLYNKAKTEILDVPDKISGSVTIPNSITSIGYRAFGDCTGLTSVEIPNSVTSIGVRAFEGCSGLTVITIPSNMQSIGTDAFYNCSNLYLVYNKSKLDIVKGSTTYGYVAYYADGVVTIGGTGIDEEEDAVKEVYYIGMNGQRYETIVENAPIVKVTVMQSGKVKTEKEINR